MKRLFCAAAAAIMLLAFSGCKPAVNPNGGASQPGVVLNTPESKPKEGAHGTLFLVSRDKEMNITAIQLSGNKAGSKDFNEREPAFSDIRSVFEVNEELEAVVSYTGSGTGKRYICFCRHRPISDYTNYKPTDYSIWFTEVQLEEGIDVKFTVPGDYGPGDYDLIIAGEDMVSAYTVIRVFNEGELSSKTDAELEALMKQIAAE